MKHGCILAELALVVEIQITPTNEQTSKLNSAREGVLGTPLSRHRSCGDHYLLVNPPLVLHPIPILPRIFLYSQGYGLCQRFC